MGQFIVDLKIVEDLQSENKQYPTLIYLFFAPCFFA